MSEIVVEATQGVLNAVAERYASHGYVASGQVDWPILEEQFGPDLNAEADRLVAMGAVTAEPGGLRLSVPMRLEVLRPPVLRQWVTRIENMGRPDFQSAATQLTRAELASILEWTAHNGSGLAEADLQTAAGCAGALVVGQLAQAPAAFAAVVWHPAPALDKLAWLMRQRAGSIEDADELQRDLRRFVGNPSHQPLAPLPLGRQRQAPGGPRPGRPAEPGAGRRR